MAKKTNKVMKFLKADPFTKFEMLLDEYREATTSTQALMDSEMSSVKQMKDAEKREAKIRKALREFLRAMVSL